PKDPLPAAERKRDPAPLQALDDDAPTGPAVVLRIDLEQYASELRVAEIPREAAPGCRKRSSHVIAGVAQSLPEAFVPAPIAAVEFLLHRTLAGRMHLGPRGRIELRADESILHQQLLVHIHHHVEDSAGERQAHVVALRL